jgi:hypothetical protein
MIPDKPQPSRIDQFREGPHRESLVAFLKDPAIIEMMSILRDSIKINPLGIKGVLKEHQANAPMAIAMDHAVVSGGQAMIDLIERLATVKKEASNSQEILTKPAFSHIDETYLEQINQ